MTSLMRISVYKTPEHVLTTHLGLDFSVHIERVIDQVQPIFVHIKPPDSLTGSTLPKSSGKKKAASSNKHPRSQEGTPVGAEHDADKPKQKRRKKSKLTKPPSPKATIPDKQGMGEDQTKVIGERHSHHLQGKGPRVKYLKNGGLVHMVS